MLLLKDNVLYKPMCISILLLVFIGIFSLGSTHYNAITSVCFEEEATKLREDKSF